MAESTETKEAVGRTKEVKAVAAGNSQFSTDILNGLKDSHPGNLLYSPFSISAAVAMAKLGARGITADEITRILRFPADDVVLAKGYSKIMATLQEKTDGVTLSAAIRFYSNVGFQIKKKFAKTVKDNFLVDVEQLDFSRSVPAAKRISLWVENNTNGKIKNLIRPEDLNSRTGIVLVSGVYFKGLWEHRFKPEFTRKSDFFLSETESVKVDMMFMTANFPYGEFTDLDAKAIAVPFKGDRLAMIIITPNSKTGMDKIEEGLKNYSPERILINLSEQNVVAVKLPPFKLECSLHLVPLLKKLGISAMFEHNMDLGGIIQSSKTPEGLYVSKVIQKVFIEVDGEATENAAAAGKDDPTGFTTRPPNPRVRIPFDGDRPFLFQIVERNANLVLFTGRCSNPLEQ